MEGLVTVKGLKKAEAKEIAQKYLSEVGMADYAAHKPSELSGGQCQRIAIARALIGKPSIILADEPTGSLDKATATHIMDLLLSLNRERGVTLIMVTHDVLLANQLDRQIKVIDGEVHEVPTLGIVKNG